MEVQNQSVQEIKAIEGQNEQILVQEEIKKNIDPNTALAGESDPVIKIQKEDIDKTRYGDTVGQKNRDIFNRCRNTVNLYPEYRNKKFAIFSNDNFVDQCLTYAKCLLILNFAKRISGDDEVKAYIDMILAPTEKLDIKEEVHYFKNGSNFGKSKIRERMVAKAMPYHDQINAVVHFLNQINPVRRYDENPERTVGVNFDRGERESEDWIEEEEY